jgi:hypothetical protein
LRSAVWNQRPPPMAGDHRAAASNATEASSARVRPRELGALPLYRVKRRNLVNTAPFRTHTSALRSNTSKELGREHRDRHPDMPEDFIDFLKTLKEQRP